MTSASALQHLWNELCTKMADLGCNLQVNLNRRHKVENKVRELEAAAISQEKQHAALQKDFSALQVGFIHHHVMHQCYPASVGQAHMCKNGFPDFAASLVTWHAQTVYIILLRDGQDLLAILSEKLPHRDFGVLANMLSRVPGRAGIFCQGLGGQAAGVQPAGAEAAGGRGCSAAAGHRAAS